MSLWKVDFSVSTNEDWVDTIAVVENQGEEDEVAYDLTGAELRMQIRSKAETLKVLLELSTDNGRLIIEDPVGDELYPNKITVYVPQATVDNLKPGNVYVYDIVWTRPDSQVINFIAGTVAVNLGVTRDDN